MKIPNNKNKLYCAFVDFTQAFDRMEHGLLWYKLFDAGLSTRMCNAIKAMFNLVKSLVRCNKVMSDSFESLYGVKQRDPLPPLMFIFFIYSMSHEIEPMSNDDVFVDNTLKLFSLMYADDAVLFAKTRQGPKSMLDTLSMYCKTWNLKVNTSKTKLMIF